MLILKSIIDLRRTSSDNVEFPHPSMRIREDLLGMSVWRSSAKSAYDLNQSKDSLFPTLP